MGTQYSQLVRTEEIAQIRRLFAVQSLTLRTGSGRELSIEFELISRDVGLDLGPEFLKQIRMRLIWRELELEQVLGVTDKTEFEIQSRRPTRFQRTCRDIWSAVADMMLARVEPTTYVLHELTSESWTVEVPAIVLVNTGAFIHDYLPYAGRATVQIVPSSDATKAVATPALVSRQQPLPTEMREALESTGTEIPDKPEYGFQFKAGTPELEELLTTTEILIYESAVLSLRSIAQRMATE